ncbi:MAG TPA: TRAP transporter substrate-binding protein [Firmicutes bacterium]|nr:TRAP transporter substrate-binding protein [Bacillota bacterium]
MKRFLREVALFAVVTMVFALMGTVGGVALAKPKTYVFRLAIEMPVGHPYWLGASKFNELLQAKTGGRAKIEIYPSGQLGTQKDTAEAVAMGALDFAMTMTSILERYDSRFEVVSLPFVFRDWDHCFKTVDGAFGEKMNSWAEAKGIKIVSYFLNGDLHVTSRIPISTPADMKGIKLRVQQAATMIEFGKALGCVVSPMPYGEIYTALQLGTIDAEVQNIANVLFDKHYEVAKYINESTPFFYLEPLLMSKAVYDSLPGDIQAAVIECAREAARWQRSEYLRKRDQEYIPELKKHGVKFLSSDQEMWRKAIEAAGYYKAFQKHQALIDEISKIK